MPYLKFGCTLTLSFTFIFASGCATQADVAELRADIDTLTRNIEADRAESNEALSTARLAREEIDSVRATAEQGAREAAATRRLLEEIDSRMGGSLGSNNLK